jgi:hypothetical protein
LLSFIKISLIKFSAALSLDEFGMNSTLSLGSESFPHENKFETVRKIMKAELKKLKKENTSEDEENKSLCSIVLAVGVDFVITWATGTRAAAGVPPSAHTARIVHPAVKFVQEQQEERRRSSGVSEKKKNNVVVGGVEVSHHHGSASGSMEEDSSLIKSFSEENDDNEEGLSEGVGLLMNGGFLYFDIDDKLVGVAEFTKQGIDCIGG